MEGDMKSTTKLGLVFGLMLALAVAGCGAADGDNGVATAGGNATSGANAGQLSNEELALRFAKCMRENGLPNFPDPQTNGDGGAPQDPEAGVAKETVAAAREACKQYQPNGGERKKADASQVEQFRQLAACMRQNGFPNFPDPTEDGLVFDEKSGINPTDPKFQAAQKKCDTYGPASSGSAGPGVQNGSNG
jgi:hypothetical protein